MYSHVKNNNDNHKTAKGIRKNVIKHDLRHDDNYTMRTIRSNNHNIGSYEINKLSLSIFDDKRYLRKDGVRSYTYGHRKIVC